ncbi:DUF2007 domain-containing protein [Chloroflexi bacterium TSY]|nr:DUF2007 domain-containing protein [Chloroflexi bacterium TSY]
MTTYVDRISGLIGKRVRHNRDGSVASTAPTSTDPEVTSETRATTGGTSEQEPVVVWEAMNQMEAQIVKGRLISEGIPAILRGEALGTIYGLTSGNLAATDVLVPGPLAEKALTILHDDVVWEEFEELGEFDESSE